MFFCYELFIVFNLNPICTSRDQNQYSILSVAVDEIDIARFFSFWKIIAPVIAGLPIYGIVALG